MTEREKIISLARECGFDTTDEQIVVVDSEIIWITKRMVAFYHAAQDEAFEAAAKVAESTVWKQHHKFNDGEPFKAHMHWEDIAASIRDMAKEQS